MLYEKLLAESRCHTVIWDNPALVLVWPLKHRIVTVGNRLVRLHYSLRDGRWMGYDEVTNTLVVSMHPMKSAVSTKAKTFRVR